MSDQEKDCTVYFGLGYKPEQRQFVYLAFGPDKDSTTSETHVRATAAGVKATAVHVVEIDTSKESKLINDRLLRWLAEQDILGVEAAFASREIWFKMLEVLTNAYRYLRSKKS